MQPTEYVKHVSEQWEAKERQYAPRHVISNNVAFLQDLVKTQTSLCSLLLGLESPNDVQSVA